MSVPNLHIRPGNPDFLDLPWDRPVDESPKDITVDVPTGIHRHPIVFVVYDEGIYAIKELPLGGSGVTAQLSNRHRRATEAGRAVDSQAMFVAWIEAGMPGFEPVPEKQGGPAFG